MSLYRVWRMIERVWTGCVRDTRTIFALVLVPVGAVLLVGYVMRESGETPNVALVVTANEWAGQDASLFVEESLTEDGVDHYRALDVESAEDDVHDGRADAYIVIDDAFVNGVLSGTADPITIAVRGDDQGGTDALLADIGHALAMAPLKAVNTATGGETPAEGPLELDAVYLFGGDDLDSLDYLMPSLIGYVSFLSIFTITVVAFTQERFTRMLERMLSTAASRLDILAGYTAGYLGEAALQTAFILAIAVFVFDAHNAGGILLVILITLLTALSAIVMGLLLSSFAKTEQQAMQSLPIIMVPQLILCGVLFPTSALPESLQIVAQFLPLTYGVDGLRDVMIRGFGITNPSVVANIVVLLAFASVFSVLGLRTLENNGA